MYTTYQCAVPCPSVTFSVLKACVHLLCLLSSASSHSSLLSSNLQNADCQGMPLLYKFARKYYSLVHVPRSVCVLPSFIQAMLICIHVPCVCLCASRCVNTCAALCLCTCGICALHILLVWWISPFTRKEGSMVSCLYMHDLFCCSEECSSNQICFILNHNVIARGCPKYAHWPIRC